MEIVYFCGSHRYGMLSNARSKMRVRQRTELHFRLMRCPDKKTHDHHELCKAVSQAAHTTNGYTRKERRNLETWTETAKRTTICRQE